MFRQFVHAASNSNLAGLAAIVAATAVGATNAFGGEEGEIGVGRTVDNRLIALVGFDAPKIIPRSVFPGIPGFATGVIGFENILLDHPEEGAYTLSPSSDISVRLTHHDAGFFVYDGGVPLAVGQSIYFGPPSFDYHPIYTIPSYSAQNGQEFEIRMVLHDASGTYADSEEFSIILTPACVSDVDDGSATGVPDGGVGIEDLLFYLELYDGGSPLADVDDGAATGVPDGGVGIEDLLYYLVRYDAGC